MLPSNGISNLSDLIKGTLGHERLTENGVSGIENESGIFLISLSATLITYSVIKGSNILKASIAAGVSRSMIH
jgi:hypothetical protein